MHPACCLAGTLAGTLAGRMLRSGCLPALLLVLSHISQPHPCAHGGIVLGEKAAPVASSWAVEQLSHHGDAQLAEAAALFRAGRLAESRERLAELASQNPALPHPDLALVWLLLSDRQLATARGLLEEVAAGRPRDPLVGLTLGQVAVAEGRLADAAAQLEKAALLPFASAWSERQRTDTTRSILSLLATVYERQRRWQDLLPILEAVQRLAPPNASHCIRLARCHYELHDLAATHHWLTQAAHLSGGATPRDLLLAEIAFHAGRYQDAEQAILAALEKHPKHAQVQLWFCEWRLLHGDLEQAERALATVRELNSVGSRYWLLQARIAFQRGEFSEAVTGLRAAVAELADEADPQRTLSAQTLLALALVAEGSPAGRAEALPLAEQSALEVPRDPFLVGSLGWIYLQCGRQAEGMLLLERTVELSAQPSADVNFFLAEYRLASEEPEAARDHLQRALQSSMDIPVMRALAKKRLQTLDSPLHQPSAP
jgi:tetratricopeptide (TPR) repeat protein